VHGRGLTLRCAALAFAALALTGCGEDQTARTSEEKSSSASPSPSNHAPACATIWQEGSELPRSYKGCNSDAGLVAPDGLGCSSGQRMVRYGDHFYAVLGGTIHETESLLEDDRGYRATVASCRA